MSTITCGYCGRAFAEDQGQPTCASCPLRRGCRFLRCPHCGYENPSTPALLQRVRQLLRSSGPRSGPDSSASVTEELRGS